jgi:selenide, water dikinase
MKHPFDLLSTVETGGCSAKLPAQLLDTILREMPFEKPDALLVGAETSDDAAVWKIDDETAIIHTVDFFPPICSDPYEFGQIAAANALSDIYAMGGKLLTALNIVMFPSAKIDISVLKELLRGGADKIKEAGGVLAGGHTIDDFPPKYGLAVLGIVHPERIIKNCSAKDGDLLILTKPIGIGAIVAGHRLGEISKEHYQQALDNMKQLNKNAVDVMQKYNIQCATDITGFSLMGHAFEMAKGSNVRIELKGSSVPLLDGAYDMINMGCIPGAAFNNMKFVGDAAGYADDLDYNTKMLMFDGQTSGGLLIACNRTDAEAILSELKGCGFPYSTIVGEVYKRTNTREPFVLLSN